MRKRIPVIPWGGAYKSWAAKKARQSIWTLQQSVRWMDWRDLHQEFALVFMKCQRVFDESRLKGGIDGRERLLMAMFKVACHHRMTDILRDHVIVRNHPGVRRHCEFPMSNFENDAGTSNLPEAQAPTSWLDAELAEALQDAPESVQVYLTECILGDEDEHDTKAVEALVGVSFATLRVQIAVWAERRLILLQNPAVAC